MAQAPRPRSPSFAGGQGTQVSAADYRPEEDVERLAQYFAQRYGSLEKALDTFDAHYEFDLYDFEVALKKWGVKVNSVVHLFDHIDADWSGKISVEEFFAVLQLPVAEVQEREKRRKREETTRTLDKIAKCLRVKFQSVEEAVAKYSPQDPGASEAGMLSLARFRTLVNGLGVQLDAAHLNHVFYEIDQNRSGTISIGELQRALAGVLVRDELAALADGLAQRHEGDIDAAFRNLGELQHPSSLDKFLRMLRHLGAEVSEDAARLMFSCMDPNFKIEDFAQSLKDVHRQSLEERRRAEEEKKRREREQRRKVRRMSLLGNSRQRVQRQVQDWSQKATQPHSQVDEVDLMDAWLVGARAGRSALQLDDYVSVLKEQVGDAMEEAHSLRTQVEKEAKEVEGLRDYLVPTPSQAAPNLAWSGDATPLSPSTPYPTPANRAPWSQAAGHVDLTTKSKAERAQRLIQAASVGDVQVVMSCLNSRVDVNAVAWGGVTALMAAACHGRRGVAEVLCSRQADLQRTDLRGRTAMDHARKQPQLRDWLSLHGGLTRAELQADTEALARLLRETEEERAQLRARQEQLPSREVVQTAKLRQAQRQAFLEAPHSFGMSGGSPMGIAQREPMGSPMAASDVSPSPAQPMRSALASGLPGVGVAKHVRLDCLPPRRPA